MKTLLFILSLAVLAFGCNPTEDIPEEFRRSIGRYESSAISHGGSASANCAVLLGKVKCWGENHYGTLGLGDYESRGDDLGEMGIYLPEVEFPDGVYISSVHATNTNSFCALSLVGKVYCWGSNFGGALGLGHIEMIGDQIDEMANNLVETNLGETVVQLAAGNRHFCALLESGSVKCWGAFTFSSYDPNNDLFVGDEEGEMGGNLATIGLGSRKATSISARFAVLEDGSLYHMNLPGDESGYLPAVGDVSLNGKKALMVSSTNANACVLLDDGSINCYGIQYEGTYINEDVSLGVGKTVQKISVGPQHTCAILDDDSVKCWGQNINGQLGYGHDSFVSASNDLLAVDLGEGRTARDISVGVSQTCALLDNFNIKCWGLNSDGRLGLDDKLSRGDDPDEMGDNLPAIPLW